MHNKSIIWTNLTKFYFWLGKIPYLIKFLIKEEHQKFKEDSVYFKEIAFF